MTLVEMEQIFINSTEEGCKRFLKRNMKQLAQKQLLGHFYKLYAQKTHKEATKKEEWDPYKVLNEPLARTIGGDLDD